MKNETEEGEKSSASKPPYIDSDGNEITSAGKFWSGFFLVLLTFFCVLYLIAHWPDRLPGSNESKKNFYTFEWFHVKLVDSIIDPAQKNHVNDKLIAEKSGIITDSGKQNADSLNPKKDTSLAAVLNKSILQTGGTENKLSSSRFLAGPENKLVNLNTLLLILVAVGGFLGNMIYISSSFTTFIGNGQFKKSWLLWYFVKPFTAAALAVAIYFVFRGGFLNMSDDSVNINLYGLMTISILAGLFTDRTTLKLKEVFDVLLQPKEERNDPISNTDARILNVTPLILVPGKASTITINGKNLDKKTINIKIDGKEITNVNKQPSAITFEYTPAPELQTGNTLKLQITDDKGASLYPETDLKIRKD